MKANKYWVTTFGCQMNKSDSERIASFLEKKEYQPASEENEADLIIVNMCSVRQSAVDRVYGQAKKFKEIKEKNKKLKTILTGCILEKDKKKFEKEFDLVLKIKDLPYWQIKSHNAEKKDNVRDKTNKENYLDIKPKYENKFSFFVPISNGCDNACTYCAVPFTRGRLVCRDHKKIIGEVKDIAQKNGKEIWLLGQNVNDYFSPTDKTIDFAKLLEAIDSIKGNFWIRFTSPHPRYFSNNLIKVMAKAKKITPYLNLPAQSGDDEILKKMNRPYSSEEYKLLVKEIRKEIPDIALSTDIIVGFPGETKKQFQNTAKLLREIKYDMAYIAQYSPRPGTVAEKMGDNVPKIEKERREKELSKILEKTALEKNKKFIGKIEKVLVLQEKNGFLLGKSFHYKTVKFKGEKSLIGKFINLKIKEALPWGLKGEL